MSNDSFNRGGMALYAIGFVLTLGFFGYVLAVNPGPIDNGSMVVAQFTSVDAEKRTTAWKELTPENVAYGKNIYGTNCAYCHSSGGQDLLTARLASGALKFGNKPLEIYRYIRKGADGQHRLDFVPEREKWAAIAFIRSQLKDAPDDSASAWKSFLKDGLY